MFPPLTSRRQLLGGFLAALLARLSGGKGRESPPPAPPDVPRPAAPAAARPSDTYPRVIATYTYDAGRLRDPLGTVTTYTYDPGRPRVGRRER